MVRNCAFSAKVSRGPYATPCVLEALTGGIYGKSVIAYV
jgi:hypothetical protein